MKALILMEIIFNFSMPKFENPLIYAGFSGIVPGLGNYLSGDKEVAKLFFFSEATLLFSYFLMNNNVNNIVSDYRVFANIYADANPGIKSEDYWIKVEDYFSYDQYIEYLRRQARSIYPNDLKAQEEYVEKHRIKDKWKWSSEREWIRFINLRAKERKLEQRKRLVFLGIVLNHITSFIETYFLSKKKIEKWKMGFRMQKDRGKIFVEYKF